MSPHRFLLATLRSPGEPQLVCGAVTGDRGAALVVKAAFTYTEAPLRPANEPASLAPSDFVPPKQDAEIILRGHAHAERPTTRMEASIDVDGIVRTLVAESPVAATRLPLPTEPDKASPEEALPIIMDGARVALTGLSPHAPSLAFNLPHLTPRASIERDHGPPAAIDLVCDTMLVDTDREVVELSWRGPLSPGSAERVLVWWSHPCAPRGVEEARGDLARAAFSYATLERDLAEGPRLDPRETAQLLRARHAALGLPAKPALPIERYAAISAEIQEKRETRAEILARHGLTEDGWTVEERAWGEAMAEGAMRGDALVAARFGEAFLAAQDALAGPEESARTIDDYVPLQAAMSTGSDPAKVLARAGMTLPVWMRLDRRFAAAMRDDPALARDVDRRVAETREAMGDIEEEPLDVDAGEEDP